MDSIMLIVGLVAGSVMFAWLLWSHYLTVMSLYRAYKKYRAQGKRLPWMSKLFGAPHIPLFLIEDFVFNIFPGSLMFLELPRYDKREWLLTARLSRWNDTSGWRGRLSKELCRQMLDPFQDGGHCWAIILAVVLVLAPTTGYASGPEASFTRVWCEQHGGIWSEHRLNQRLTIRHAWDGRVVGFADCLVKDGIVEVDHGDAWKEGVSQALWYSMHTGQKAILVLITTKDSNHFRDAVRFIEHYKLPVRVEAIQ